MILLNKIISFIWELYMSKDNSDIIKIWTGKKKIMQTWSINLQQRNQEYTMGKMLPLQLMLLGQLNSHKQKNKTGPLS